MQVQRCGRCHVVLIKDEIEHQRWPDRWRCEACDSMHSLTDWLNFASIHTSTKELAETEWCERIRHARV